MALDKQLARLEAKLDAILEKAGLDPADFTKATGKTGAKPPRELTPAQQEAINNAPKYIEPKPVGSQPPPAQPTPGQQAPAPDATNAPDLHNATPEETKAAGLTDEEAKTAEATGEVPWAGYDAASSEVIIERLRGMDVDARERALAYERKNKNRVTITRVNWNS